MLHVLNIPSVACKAVPPDLDTSSLRGPRWLSIEHLASKGEECGIEIQAQHLGTVGVRFVPDDHEATHEAVSWIMDYGSRDVYNSSSGGFDMWIVALLTYEIHERPSIWRRDTKLRNIATIGQRYCFHGLHFCPER